MTTILLGALVAFAMGTAIEGYLQFGRVQLLLNYAERLLGAAGDDGHDEQLADHGAVIDARAADIDAICAHVGLALTDDEPVPDAKTDEIPAQPGLPTEPMAVIAATPAVQARRDTAWDADAAQLPRPTPHKRTTASVERQVGGHTFRIREEA